MLSRRGALRSALVVVPLGGVLSGCADESARSVSSPSGAATKAHASLRVGTALGVFTLQTASEQAVWAGRLRSAAQRVADVWGSGAGRDAHLARTVTICADDAEFARVADGLDADTAGVTTSAGVFVSPTAVRTLTPQGLVVLLAHELTHAVLGHVGSDATALWLREGVAEWAAERGLDLPVARLWPHLVSSVGSGSNPQGPPTDADFTHDRALAYEQATAYVTYAVAMLGTATIVRLTRTRPNDATARRVMTKALAGHPTFATWLSGHPAGP